MEPSHWIERAPQKRLMVVAGPVAPRARAEDRGAARRRARRRHPQDVRRRRDLLPLRGVGARRGHVHRPDRREARRPEPLGAPDHGQRGQARLGEADHRRHPVVLLLAPGQEVAAARADHREARRGRAPDRGRRPRADDGPARRPGAGLLQRPRRPHDRGADVRAVLPRPRPRRRPRRGRARHRPHEARGQVRRDDRRRPRRPEQGAARAQRRQGDERDRRGRGQGRRDDRRHHRHRRHAVRGRRGAEGGGRDAR